VVGRKENDGLIVKIKKVTSAKVKAVTIDVSPSCFDTTPNKKPPFLLTLFALYGIS
jgi:hypothetical protein